MRNGGLQRYAERRRRDAESELAEELRAFSFDGLVQLSEDLQSGNVVRGSWAGCVMSYRRGAAGSTHRDRCGRARNAFTVLWDGGWITDEDVKDAVVSELRRRHQRAPAMAAMRGG